MWICSCVTEDVFFRARKNDLSFISPLRFSRNAWTLSYSREAPVWIQRYKHISKKSRAGFRLVLCLYLLLNSILFLLRIHSLSFLGLHIIVWFHWCYFRLSLPPHYCSIFSSPCFLIKFPLFSFLFFLILLHKMASSL